MGAKRVRKIERNRGGYLLGRQGLKNTEIAKRIGVTPPAVGQFIKGAAKPGEALREVISKAFPIPVTAWDEPPRSRKPAEDKAPEAASEQVASPTPIPEGVLPKVALLESFLTRLLEGLAEDPDSTPAEQLDVYSKATAILEKLGKVTGEHAIDRAKVLGHREFKRAVEVISEAVRPWPEAAAAIAAALRKLDGE